MTDTPEGTTPEAPPARDYGPQLTFEVLGVAHEPFAAQPTLRFEMGVSEPSDREIYAISLTAQINFDPARRGFAEGAMLQRPGARLTVEKPPCSPVAIFPRMRESLRPLSSAARARAGALHARPGGRPVRRRCARAHRVGATSR